MIGLMIILLALALIVVNYLAKRFVRPINEMLKVTRAVKEGKHTNRPLPKMKKGDDEIAELSIAFKEMVVELQEKEKIRTLLDRVLSKDIAEEILKNEVHLGGGEEGAAEVEIDPFTQEVRLKVSENFSKKWEKGKKLCQLVSELNLALTQSNTENTFAILSEITALQVDPEIPNTHIGAQREVNEALRPLLATKKEGEAEEADDLLLHLYFSQLSTKAVRTWGHSLPHMKQVLVDKLDNQLFTTAETETPFKNAAQKLSDCLSMPAGEEVLVSLLRTDAVQITKDRLCALLETQVTAGAKMAVMAGVDKVAAATSDEVYEEAYEEESINRKALFLVQQVVDPTKPTIDALDKIIAELEAYAAAHPEARSIVATLVEKWKKIKASGANLNYKDLVDFSAEINTALTKINNPDLSVKCLTYLKKALEAFASTISQGTAEIDKMIAEMQKTLDTYKQNASDVSIILELIKKLQRGEQLSREEYMQLAKAYMRLGSQDYNSLTQEIKDALTTVTQAMQNLTINGVSLLHALAYCYLYDSLPTEAMSAQEIQKWIEKSRASIEELKKQAKNNPALRPLVEALEKILPPGTGYQWVIDNIRDPFSGEKLFNYAIGGWQKNTKNITDWHFEKADKRALDDAVAELSRAVTMLERKVRYLSNDIAACKQARGQIIAMQAQMKTLNDLIAEIGRHIINDKSLPDDFYDLIINEYMPIQEARLRAFAAKLYFMNLGGTFFGALTRDINSWNIDRPPLHYDFATWYKEHAGDKDMDLTKMRAQFETETKDIDRNWAQAQAAIDKVDVDTKKVAEELKAGKITKTDADKLLGKLGATKADLVKAQGNLTNLKTQITKLSDCKTLDQIKTIMEKEGGTKALETAVNNGTTDPKTKERTSKGLQEIYTDISGTAGEFSSEGTNAQTDLQACMMQMQQQWMICTTSIKTLFDSMRVCAQGINSH